MEDSGLLFLVLLIQIGKLSSAGISFHGWMDPVRPASSAISQRRAKEVWTAGPRRELTSSPNYPRRTLAAGPVWFQWLPF